MVPGGGGQAHREQQCLCPVPGSRYGTSTTGATLTILYFLLAVGRWFPPGTPVSSTIKLISSSFHRRDMTLAVAEALNPIKPNINPPSTGSGGGTLDRLLVRVVMVTDRVCVVFYGQLGKGGYKYKSAKVKTSAVGMRRFLITPALDWEGGVCEGWGNGPGPRPTWGTHPAPYRAPPPP